MPELRSMKLYRNVSQLIRDLLGASASITGDHAINKPPRHGSETPWHQDEAYWDPMLDYSSVSVWVPLQPATVSNGCMHFVPGSHRMEVQAHRSIGNDPRVHGLELEPGKIDVSTAVACELPAGGATLHHNRTLHYAPGNRTDDYRRALIIVGGLPPVQRSIQRRFPWLEQRTTAREKRARSATV